MRRFILLIIALATLLPTLAQAYDVLILQSRRDAGFEEVLKGFRTASNRSQRVIVLSDYAEVDVARIVREERPLAVLAVGDAALAVARKITRIPVVSVLSLGIHNGSSVANVSGVGMFAPPDSFLELFRKCGTQRIGVVYNGNRTGWYIRKARKAAKKAGIELVTREVSSSREVPGQLASLAGKVDAMWMLPDTMAVTRETTEAWFHFGQEQQVPVYAFADAYLKLGAAAAVEIDRLEMGKQAATIAASILNGNRDSIMSPAYPAVTAVKTNPVVLRRLGITLAD